MSEEKPPGSVPPLPPAPLPAGAKPPAPAPPPPLPAGAKPPAGQTPGLQQQTTVPPAPGRPAPPIDFAIPAPKKPFTIPKYAGCLVKMVFGFAVLLVMGYCALIALNPKAREWATSKAGPTPFTFVNQILAIPAQAIGKTKDVVAASDARVGVLDKVIAEDEGKGKREAPAVVTDPFAPAAPAAGISPARAAAAAEGKPGDAGISRSALLALAEKNAVAPDRPVTPAPAPEPAAPAQVKLAGGIIISSAAPAGAPVARASFFYWVVNQNISGVFQSPPHRVMLNGRLAYEGDEISRALGITFDHLDSANKLIVFRDKSGAIVTRSY